MKLPKFEIFCVVMILVGVSIAYLGITGMIAEPMDIGKCDHPIGSDGVPVCVITDPPALPEDVDITAEVGMNLLDGTYLELVIDENVTFSFERAKLIPRKGATVEPTVGPDGRAGMLFSGVFDFYQQIDGNWVSELYFD